MWRLFVFTLLLITYVSFPSFSTLAETNVFGPITENTTWGLTSPDPNGEYRVTGDVTVQDGSTLTIEPGVIVRFNDHRVIYVGGSMPGDSGRLLADGTDSQPVLFTAVSAAPNSCGGIWFRETAENDSVMDYCTVSYGGYYLSGNIRIEACSPTITNTNSTYSGGYGFYIRDGSSATLTTCEAQYCDSYGIYVENGSPAISGSEIRDCERGLYMSSSSQPSVASCHFQDNNYYPIEGYCRHIPDLSGNTFSGNLNQQIFILAETVSTDVTWPAANIPYRVNGGFAIQGQDGPDGVATLTLEPGVTLNMSSTALITVGHATSSASPGALVAVGTSTDKITFSAATSSPAPGYWSGIQFLHYSDDTQCELTHCIVEYAGYSSYENIFCDNASPTLTHTESRFGSGAGIFCQYNSDPEIDTCHLHDNTTYGLYIDDNSSPLVQNTIIKDNATSGIFLQTNSSPTITGCTIANNLDYGLNCSSNDCFPVVNGNTFDGNGNYPIRIYPVCIVNLNGNTYQNHANQQIQVLGGLLDQDATWQADGVPYMIDGNIMVQGQDGPDSVTTLTLQAGVTMAFDTSAILRIGHSSNSDYPGALIANGTDVNRITFTADSATPSPGYWGGLYFDVYSDDAQCQLNHCIVEYGGYSTYENIVCDSASPSIANTESAYCQGPGINCINSAGPTIEACDIHDNFGGGIDVDSNSTALITDTVFQDNLSSGVHASANCYVSLTGSSIINSDNYGLSGDDLCELEIDSCLFDGNGNYPLNISAGSLLTFTNNTCQNHTAPQIYVRPDTIQSDSTWDSSGIPFLITGDIEIQGQDGSDNVTTLSLGPGVVFEFEPTHGLTVGHFSNSSLPGALAAVGNDTEPVTFKADNASPAPGYWDGILFNTFSDDSLCQLTYCVVEYGGYSNRENIECYSASPTISCTESRFGSDNGIFCTNNSNPTIQNCSIHDASGSGIHSSDSSPVITDTTIHSNSAMGVYIENTGSPVLTGNTIGDNGSYGILASMSSHPTITGNAVNNNDSYPIQCYGVHVAQMSGNTFIGNSYQKIFVWGDTIDTSNSWVDQGIPYLINGDLTVTGDSGIAAVLTLDPGVELQFANNSQLTIGSASPNNPGGLMAQGTSLDPILLTYDDSISPPDPAGEWDGVFFDNFASDSDCVLEHVTIEYAGMGWIESVHCDGSSPTLIQCMVQNGNGTGIYCMNSAGPSIEACYIQNNSEYGIHCQGIGSNPTVTNCEFTGNSYGIKITAGALPVIGGTSGLGNNFEGNTYYGVQNTESTTCIQAEYNWWGDSQGPDDDGFATDDCVNDGNDNDAGDTVSEDVNYLNWATSPVYTPVPNPTVTPTATPTQHPTLTPTPVLTSTPTTSPEPTDTPTPPCVHHGDLNFSGNLTAEDAQIIFNIVLGTIVPTYEEACAADCDNNGSITAGDSQVVFFAVLGLGDGCEDEITELQSGGRKQLNASPSRVNIWALE